jgi:predicted GTPase
MGERMRDVPELDREQLLAKAGELGELARELVPERSRYELEQAARRLSEDRLNLVVVGEFKRGKSTLINALLERDLLPTGVVPLTSIITLVRFGERERLIVRFLDGSESEHPLADLNAFVTEAENPNNERGVEIAIVELPHPLLERGLQLVDTPGLGSVHVHNTETARRFFPQIDAALVVLTAEQPLSGDEQRLLAELAERTPKLFYAVNKVDVLGPGEKEIALDFIRSRLADVDTNGNPELFAVSARHSTGIESLHDRLQRFIASERRETLLESVALLAGTFAADAAQAARFEAHALELPLEELEGRLASFECSLAALQDAREEARLLLERAVEDIIRMQVNEPLLAYAAGHAKALESSLDGKAAAIDGGTRKFTLALRGGVEEIIQADTLKLAPELETEIADALERAEKRYGSRMRGILEEIAEAAEQAFGSRPPLQLPTLDLHTPARFTFKLRDEAQALDQLVDLGQKLVPGSLGRRLALREAKSRLRMLLDRHAGRLRSDLAERIKASAGDYRDELESALEEAIGQVRSALERAEREQRTGRRQVEIRLRELMKKAEQLDNVALALGRREKASSGG